MVTLRRLQYGFAIPRIGFGLQQEVARRIRHVQIDVESGLPQAANLERRLRARHFAAALGLERYGHAASGCMVFIVHQHHLERLLARRQFRLPEAQVHSKRREGVRHVVAEVRLQFQFLDVAEVIGRVA